MWNGKERSLQTDAARSVMVDPSRDQAPIHRCKSSSASSGLPWGWRFRDHGTLEVTLDDNTVRVFWHSTSSNRWSSEHRMRGHSWHQAAVTASRVCETCSIGHQLASLKATEDALRIPVDEQTIQMRILLMKGFLLFRHLKDISFWLTGTELGDSLPFVLSKHSKTVANLLMRCSSIAAALCDVVGGRSLRTMTLVPGGFTRLPRTYELRVLRYEMYRILLPDLIKLTRICRFARSKFASWERVTDFVSLTTFREYALYCGQLSTGGNLVPVSEYERVVHGPKARLSGNPSAGDWSYRVGPLARFNNNWEDISDLARNAAGELGLSTGYHNPFLSNLVRLVECMHCTESAINSIDLLLSRGLDHKDPPLERPYSDGGRGIGVVEAPEGPIIHDYTYDDRGRLMGVRVIEPVHLNLPSLRNDLEGLYRLMIKTHIPRPAMRSWMRLLVRTCDPYLYCSFREKRARRG